MSTRVHFYKQTDFLHHCPGLARTQFNTEKKNIFNCIRVYARWQPRIWGGEKEQEESLGVAVEIQRYTLPYVKQIASGDLLYDSGNSNWGCVTI